ncbi:MAG: ATP-binding protein [Acidobacteriota bacterium]|jgi:DNA replication protein DnaC
MASEERDQLLANLRRLQLRHAANRIDDLLREAAQLKLGHLGFLARVVETEVLGRTETATNRRIHEAHFPQLWRIEDYDFKEQPCLDRKTILDLAELGFLDRCESVFFLGPSGVGKSHLSVGLGVRACAAGYRVRYVRTYDMLKDLLASMADETFDNLLEDHCRPDLLILDEVGNHPANPVLAERNFAGVFYEVVHQRYRHGSVILASNLGVNDWATALGGPPGLVATALDRLLEGAHIIAFPPDAPSHRTRCERGPGPLPKPRPRRRNGAAGMRRSRPEQSR